MMTDMIDQIRADREAGTPGPWILCAHLADAETDKNCRCGYRGVIYGPGAEAMAICQPGHESPPVGEEYTEPQRYARSAELANARRIARVPDLEAAYLASVARIAELEAALVDAEELAHGMSFSDQHIIASWGKRVEATCRRALAKEPTE